MITPSNEREKAIKTCKIEQSILQLLFYKYYKHRQFDFGKRKLSINQANEYPIEILYKRYKKSKDPIQQILYLIDFLKDDITLLNIMTNKGLANDEDATLLCIEKSLIDNFFIAWYEYLAQKPFNEKDLKQIHYDKTKVDAFSLSDIGQKSMNNILEALLDNYKYFNNKIHNRNNEIIDFNAKITADENLLNRQN